MNIKFKKDITLDYESRRLDEVTDASFSRGEVFDGVNVVNLSKGSNFSDIYFADGNVALDVPNDSFEIC